MDTKKINQNDVEVVVEWCRQQVPRGYQDTEGNGLLILETIPDGTPVTLESLTAAAQSLVNKGVALFRFKSLAEQAFDKTVALLTQGQRETVHSWLLSQNRLIQDGDQGYENVTQICNWLLARRFQITNDSLNNAVGNLVNNSAARLHFKTVEQNYQPGRHSGKSFHDSKAEEQSRNFIHGRINHANQPHIVEQSVSPKTLEAEWARKCDSIQGKTHSQTQQVRRLLVTKPDGTPDYRATYESRIRFLESRNGERF